MKLYKAKEMADILQLSTQTVYRMGRDGRIKTIRVGRAVRLVMPGFSTLDEQLTSDENKNS